MRTLALYPVAESSDEERFGTVCLWSLLLMLVLSACTRGRDVLLSWVTTVIVLATTYIVVFTVGTRTARFQATPTPPTPMPPPPQPAPPVAVEDEFERRVKSELQRRLDWGHLPDNPSAASVLPPTRFGIPGILGGIH
jgi:hypothetical protein